MRNILSICILLFVSNASANIACVSFMAKEKAPEWLEVIFGSNGYYHVHCSNGDSFKTEKKYNFSLSSTRTNSAFEEEIAERGLKEVELPYQWRLKGGPTHKLITKGGVVPADNYCVLYFSNEGSNSEGVDLYTLVESCRSLRDKKKTEVIRHDTYMTYDELIEMVNGKGYMQIYHPEDKDNPERLGFEGYYLR